MNIQQPAVFGPQRWREVAREASRRGGRILAERFQKELKIEYKGRTDLVTDADKASEKEIIDYIQSHHPDDALLAEESGTSRGSLASQHATVRWIIDPLDGTTNFAHQVPHFCVSIGVEDSHGLAAGAVYDPIRNELFSAARGEGADLNGEPIYTSSANALQTALLCTGFPYDLGEQSSYPLGLFGHLVRRSQGIRRMGSAALDLAYVAAGRFDGFFEYGLKPWDLAAGALLVLESGGKLGSLDGGAFDLARGDVYALAPRLELPFKKEMSLFIGQRT